MTVPAPPVGPAPDTSTFRSALTAWLDGPDAPSTHDGTAGFDDEVAQLGDVRRALWEAGWMRYGWPEAVGGYGGPSALRAVLGEEVATRGLAQPGLYSMVEVLVPTVLAHADPEVAARYVPRLLGGTEQWCQGFSEPGSGSDLASLTTRAERTSDGGWRITGQKVWTSLAQHAARCVLLARTGPEPGRAGISAFLMDMDAPGVTVRPIRTMHGVDEFCEVFLDDVAVPTERLLGGVGDGWRLAMELLPHERSTCFWHRIAHLYTRLDRLAVQTTEPDARALGEAWLALHTARCRSLSTQHRLADGQPLGPETSVDKILLATAEQRLYDTARDLLPGELELHAGDWRTEWLYSRAATLYGGTAEIQRNIVARRLLGLGKE
jgi:alkylation response protein AidB-like acyl-CoA dehydrogenase